MCHRSINYVADMLEEKYGIPWVKVNFIGAGATAKSLRKIAAYFDDKALMERVEKVIAEEMAPVEAAQAEVRPRTEGKTAMLFVGGSRAHSYQKLFEEMGMRTISAGYEFAHRDDYEGREVLPHIKLDADSRNIEELDVVPHPEQYKPRVTPEKAEELEAKGVKFKEYAGLMRDMPGESIVIDDLNQYEADKLVEIIKPDIFCAGIKEKFGIQKMGIPMKQLHSYDSHGPYAAFQGAVNFYHEIDRMVNSKVWSYLTPPWEKNPELTGSYAWE